MAVLGLDTLFVITVVLFFAVILVIGYYGYRPTDDEEDFLVAGRSFGPLVGGATLSASQMSAGTLVGTFGTHYLLGVGFIWIWPRTVDGVDHLTATRRAADAAVRPCHRP